MTPTSPVFTLGYRPALDGLRGVAIAAVVLYHFHVPFFSSGYVGVDLFFVLSGFLITALLGEEWNRAGRIDFPAFYRRRASRLLPALGAVLLVLTVYAYLLRGRDKGIPMGAEILGAGLYVMNWLRAFEVIPPGGPLGHTWSLSIEEQFYFTWPLLFVAGMRSRARVVVFPALTACAALASAAFRAWHWSAHGSWNRVYFGLDTRADGILLGCLAGLLVVRRPFASWLQIPGALGIALGAALSTQGRGHLLAGAFLLNAGTAALLLGLVSPGPAGIRPLLEWRPLVYLGRISYGLYLWHILVLHALLKLSIGPWLPPVGVAASLVVAALSFALLEQPLLRRFRRGRAAVPAAAAG